MDNNDIRFVLLILLFFFYISMTLTVGYSVSNIRVII